LTLLQVFDALIIQHVGNTQELKVKARSQTALYFLRSLAIYVRKHLALVSNWEREGVGTDLSLAHALSSGARFVYLMEHKRTVTYGDTSPIRKEIVAQAVIKARIRGKSEPVYLVQYDTHARRFQLIGGRKRLTDPDIDAVMQRELEEELAQNHLNPKDYELRKLASDLQLIEISPTYGAYSEYNFTIYQAFIKRRQLVLGPNDRWVTLAELLAGTTKDRQRISGNGTNYIAELDKRLPGGLKGLPLSLDEIQTRSLSEIIKENRWEIVGLIIGILGIILSVLFFFLERP